MLCFEDENGGGGGGGTWWSPGLLGGGPGGGSGGNTTSVNYLIDNLSIDQAQVNWLNAHPDMADGILDYFFETSLPWIETKAVALEHINALMNNTDYFNFVNSYFPTSSSNGVWWEDDTWLGNPSNFNLDIDAVGMPPQSLNPAENAFVKNHPFAATVIFLNSKTAISYTDSKMGTNGLNDKSDAFRHAFWLGLNTMSIGVGATLAQQFADAHETSTPIQLALEKQMDLFNNSVGIAYGQTLGFFTSLNDLANGIYLKVSQGDLRYLKPINSADQNFWGASGTPDLNTATHGIYSATQVIPTNQ